MVQAETGETASSRGRELGAILHELGITLAVARCTRGNMGRIAVNFAILGGGETAR